MNETIVARRALPLPVIGAVAVAVTALILYGYGSAVQALGVPMHAGEIGASHADAITSGSFASGVALCGTIGIVLAIVLARFAAHPAARWTRITVTLVAISLIFPLSASHASVSTRIALAGGHLVAAAVIIPVIRGRLRR
jgi:hypothetical protein